MFGDGRKELWGALLDGTYRLGEPVGTGATGVVLRAWRESDGREVVVKVLKQSLAHRSDLSLRLRREADAARAFDTLASCPVSTTARCPTAPPTWSSSVSRARACCAWCADAALCRSIKRSP